ncbi:MAG: hypothetical protein GF398_16520 [Chitinivibrionales bacterium]|nr:hypothetical protein [Chitinivibrionales bacterium]
MKKINKFSGAIMCMLLLQTGAYTKDKTDAIVTGTITDAQTGEPLLAAIVSITGKPHMAATDKTGTFQLMTSSCHRCDLIIEKSGYQSSAFTNVTFRSGDQKRFAAKLAPRPEPQRPSLLLLSIQNDRNANPIARATIKVGDNVATAHSDANGLVSFVDLPKGEYDIIIRRDGYQPEIVKDVPVRTEQMASLNIKLEQLSAGANAVAERGSSLVY